MCGGKGEAGGFEGGGWTEPGVEHAVFVGLGEVGAIEDVSYKHLGGQAT